MSTGKGVKEKLQGVFHSKAGDPKAGSSTAPAVPEGPKPDRNAQDFVRQLNTVQALTKSRAIRDEHIRDLAKAAIPAIFSVATTPGRDGEQNYKVEYQYDNKVRFAPMPKGDKAIESRFVIPSALVVGTTSAKELKITDTKGKLESITFKKGQYQQLDLSTVSPIDCRFVFTTQLTGCTFAIGCTGTKLYIGHAQRHADAKPFATNGKDLGDNLQKTRMTMFEGVANLESTFFVTFGNEAFAVAESGITYNPGKVAAVNVIGLVSNRKFYLIVASKLPGGVDNVGVKQPERTGNVVLVTQGETDARTGTRRWRAENLPRTG